MESSDQAVPAQPPLGIYASRCDDKGRLRLPKEFEGFLKSLAEPEFFVTSLDGNIGRIYPIRTWRVNLNLLESEEENPEAAENVQFLADHFGAVATIDSQGRILVPPVLRREIGIENDKVHVRYHRGAVEIYSDAEAQRRLEQAKTSVRNDALQMRKKGLK